MHNDEKKQQQSAAADQMRAVLDEIVLLPETDRRRVMNCRDEVYALLERHRGSGILAIFLVLAQIRVDNGIAHPAHGPAFPITLPKGIQ